LLILKWYILFKIVNKLLIVWIFVKLTIIIFINLNLMKNKMQLLIVSKRIFIVNKWAINYKNVIKILIFLMKDIFVYKIAWIFLNLLIKLINIMHNALLIVQLILKHKTNNNKIIKSIISINNNQIIYVLII